MTCDDGTLVCGVACGEDFMYSDQETEGKCPAYADHWLEY
jgi:hypothetical protein